MTTALTCPTCGGPLPAEAAHAVIHCPFCGGVTKPPPRVVREVVERIVVAERTDSEEKSTLHCPRCGNAFHEGGAGDHKLFGCRTCGGVWLEQHAVARLEQAVDQGIFDAALRTVRIPMPYPHDRRREITCPVCAQRLARRHLGDTGHSVDSCASHGSFFDRGELEAFAKFHEDRRVGEVTEDDLEAAGLPTGFGFWKKK